MLVNSRRQLEAFQRTLVAACAARAAIGRAVIAALVEEFATEH